MKKLLYVACGILMSIFSTSIHAQDVTQNIRGQIVDSDSKQELIGVSLYIQNSEPLIGTVTDTKGYFVFEELRLDVTIL